MSVINVAAINIIAVSLLMKLLAHGESVTLIKLTEDWLTFVMRILLDDSDPYC